MKKSKKNKKSRALCLILGFIALAACTQRQMEEGIKNVVEEDECLTVWAWDESFNIAAANLAKQFYLQENPGVKVEVVTVAQDDVVAKLDYGFVSGSYEELPDIVLIEDYRIQGYLRTYLGEFADLSDIARAEDFASYKTGVNQVDGRMYGIPFDNGVAGLFYRTDYLEEAGYTQEDMRNLTWDEYIEIGKAVKRKTGKYMLTLNPGDLGQLRMMLQSAGAWYTDAEGDLDIWDNQALLAAISTYGRIVDAGIAKQIADWDQFVGAFNSGEVATVPTGCWVSPSIENAVDQKGKWAVAEIPRMAEVEQSVNASSLGGAGWYVPKNAGHEKEAKKFLEATFASNVLLMDQLVEEIQLVSTLKASASAGNYSKGVEFYGGQEIFKDFAAWAEKVPVINYGEDTYAVEDKMCEALQKILEGVDMDAVLQSTFSKEK